MSVKPDIGHNKSFTSLHATRRGQAAILSDHTSACIRRSVTLSTPRRRSSIKA